MVHCENCNAEVLHVWRDWEYDETMTHRTGRWVCAACHPELPASLAGVDEETESPTEVAA